MARDLDLPDTPSRNDTWGRLGGSRARWVLLLVLTLVVAPSLAVTVNLFLAESSGSELSRIDQPVLDWMIAHRRPWLDSVIVFYSYLGGPVCAIGATFLAVVGLSVWWRSWTPFLLMLIAGAGSLAMSMSTKNYADRERPEQQFAVGDLEPSFSFPSGHALNATIIAGVLAYLFIIRTGSRKVAVLAVSLALVHTTLMGMSRVYLGQHWFTDVVVAWFMSFAWLAVVLSLHQMFLRARER